MINLLICGGAGFIGSNFIRFLLDNHPQFNVINYDVLTYAGNLHNLSFAHSYQNYSFIKADICDKDAVEQAIIENKIEIIINFAAESHVDRSILDSTPFVNTNIKGTQVLLDCAKKHKVKRFVQVSTDEVYGSLGSDGLFTESTPLSPNSPYSASKAAADLMVNAYHHTFGLDTVITRCSNNYGPFQFPEKLIPLMTLNAIEGKDLPVYGKGLNVRDWIYVEDHCKGIFEATINGKSGEVYNFGGNAEKTNIEVVERLIELTNASKSQIKYVVDRPGHDLRYAIDATKAKIELNWEPKVKFEEGLKQTVEWYIANPEWCKQVRDGSYMDYYKIQYNNR